MNLIELLDRGLVEKFQSDEDQIKNKMQIAESDLASAKHLLEIKEWKWLIMWHTVLCFSCNGTDVLKRLPTERAGAPCGSNFLRAGGLSLKIQTRSFALFSEGEEEAK